MDHAGSKESKSQEITHQEECDLNNSSWQNLVSKIQTNLWKTFCYPCNTQFFFIKTFYFAFYGGLGCILPFLSLFFKQSGLTPLQIGWIWGVKPAMTLIGAPLWGAIGDGYRISRILLIGSLLVWMGVYAGIAFLPTPVKNYSCSSIEEFPDDYNSTDSSTDSNSNLLVNNNNNIYNNNINMSTAYQHITTKPQSAVNQNNVKQNRRTGGHKSVIVYPDKFWGADSDHNSNSDQKNSTEFSVNSNQNRTKKGHQHHNQPAKLVIINADESLWWLYEPGDTSKLFIMVMVLINIGEFFTSPATALADASTTQTLGAKNMEYFGTQRAWGPVGFAVR